MTSIPRALIAASAFALAVAACAGDDEPDASPDVADDVAEETTEDDTDAQDEAEQEDAAEDEEDAAEDEEAAEDEDAASGDGTSVAVDTTELGEVVVDADGLTLYMFDPDEQGPSQCYDDCESNWPPLLTDGDPVADAGADQGLLGTAERDDGSLQVTYDGWPLYHFIGDQEPGDVAGQAVNDVWWVLAADGTPMRDGADEEEAGGGSRDY